MSSAAPLLLHPTSATTSSIPALLLVFHPPHSLAVPISPSPPRLVLLCGIERHGRRSKILGGFGADGGWGSGQRAGEAKFLCLSFCAFGLPLLALLPPPPPPHHQPGERNPAAGLVPPSAGGPLPISCTTAEELAHGRGSDVAKGELCKLGSGSIVPYRRSGCWATTTHQILQPVAMVGRLGAPIAFDNDGGRQKIARAAVEPLSLCSGSSGGHIPYLCVSHHCNALDFASENRSAGYAFEGSTTDLHESQPGQREGTLKCFIRRNRTTQTYDLFIGLTEALADDGNFLRAARRCRKPRCTDYLISLDKGDVSKGSSIYIGKLRSNFLGIKFTVYDTHPPYNGAVVSKT